MGDVNTSNKYYWSVYDSQNGINGFVANVSVVVHSCSYYTFYHEQFTSHIKTLVLQTVNITNFSNTVLTVQGGNLYYVFGKILFSS